MRFRVGGSLDAAVDAALASKQLRSGTMIRADASSLGGSGPKLGQGAIWFHDNAKVGGVGPGGSTVSVRTHASLSSRRPKGTSNSP